MVRFARGVWRACLRALMDEVRRAGAYLRTALGNFGYALLILKVFTVEFARSECGRSARAELRTTKKLIRPPSWIIVRRIGGVVVGD